MAEQTGRSLSLTTEQQAKADIALSKFGSKRDLAADLRMSPTTITNFFAGRPVQRKQFHAICKKLKLNWQPDPVTLPQTKSKPSVDELVWEVGDRCRKNILKNYNQIQLYTQKHIDFEQLFVPVFICQEPRSQRESLQEKLLPKPALEIIEQYQYLIVVGKPGSGKSTFATYLARIFSKKDPEIGWIPVLLRLKDAVDTRIPFNLLELLKTAFGTNQNDTKHILERGKVILILDGLDEVSSQFRKDICHEINGLIAPNDSKIIITCRTDLRDYRLPGVFERVEITDFNGEQHNKFIENWFAVGDKDPNSWLAIKLQQRPECTSQILIKQIQQTDRLQELAKTPILLSLICLIYVDSGNLPEKRSSLYERGLEILLEDWDGDRCIENRVESAAYKCLDSDEKRQILAELARYTFEQVKDTVAFEQSTALEIITKYQKSSPKESLEILEGIAADHGLVFCSARRKWEFSHLTFQEYFVAQWFLQRQDWETITENIYNSRWQEVFLLGIEMAACSDNFLLKSNQIINLKVAGKPKVQNFLRIIFEWFPNTNSLFQLPNFNGATLDEALEWLPVIRSVCLESINEYIHDIALALSIEKLKEKIDLAQALELSQEHKYFKGFSLPIALAEEIRRVPIKELESIQRSSTIRDLSKLMKPIKDPMHITRISNSEYENLKLLMEWWELNGKEWNDNFRSFIAKNKATFQDLQLEKNEMDSFLEYYNANKLLAECLRLAQHVNNVSQAARQEIEETLLLPIAEIEKRNPSFLTQGE